MSLFRVRSRRAIAVAALLAAAAPLLVGCAGGDKSGDTFASSLFGADLTARQPGTIRSSNGDEAGPPAAQTYAGTGDPIEAGTGVAASVNQSQEGFDLNFENADIAAVVKVLLGDVLSYTYSIDPRVQGTISLSSGRPLPKADVLPALEAALKTANAAVVKDGPLFRVIPASEAIGSGGTDRARGGRPEPGYGISVMPLKYVSAQAVIRVIESFAARPGAVRIDPNRNILIIQGSSTERASAIDAALALDVDWMKNQSVGIYPVRNASPEIIISELQNIMASGEGGTGQNMVRFMPINRLNAVLAVARTREQIAQVQSWVNRLDQADYNSTGLRVYRVRFGNAKVMAGLLNEVFTGRAAATGTSDLSQLTPGSSAQRSTSGFSQTGTGTASGFSQQGGFGQQSQSNFGSSSSSGDDDDDSDGGSGGSGTGTSGAAGDQTGFGGAGDGNGPPAFRNVRITADVANNSLLVYASREQYRVIERAIREIDNAPLQVAIDTIIAEVTLSDELQYGVQFYLQSQDVGAGKNNGSGGFSASQVLRRMIPGFNLVLGPKQDPRLVLSALKTMTQVKVLSSPSLVVLDNRSATLQVGDQVPIATRSATSVETVDSPIVNTIDFRNTGVILNVTPRVNANGVVSLEVEQEISNVVGPANQSLTPTISQRRVKSSIAVASGQTVLLGGLISERRNQTRSGLPILSELKGIGELFGKTSNTVTRTELILFIRPQIIRDGVDAQLVSEELRSKLFLLSGGAPPPAAGSRR